MRDSCRYNARLAFLKFGILANVTDPISQSSRPWQLIAVELSGETNPERIRELVRELHLALCEQDVNRSPLHDCREENKTPRLLF
jgi:hypothetical protein